MGLSVAGRVTAVAIGALALAGSGMATPAFASDAPRLGIQNCWVSGATYRGVTGGEVEYRACYDIEKDDQGYKIASVVRLRREEGTPVPVQVTALVTGGENGSATSATVDLSDGAWHYVRSPWNRGTGVYNGYGTFYGPGMVDVDGRPDYTPDDLQFMHNDDAWISND
jgi:hypothetical protein